jgi:hypothetical protein
MSQSGAYAYPMRGRRSLMAALAESHRPRTTAIVKSLEPQPTEYQTRHVLAGCIPRL